jgi:hypothetical protein
MVIYVKTENYLFKISQFICTYKSIAVIDTFWGHLYQNLASKIILPPVGFNRRGGRSARLCV